MVKLEGKELRRMPFRLGMVGMNGEREDQRKSEDTLLDQRLMKKEDAENRGIIRGRPHS